MAVRWQTDVLHGLGENKGQHTAVPAACARFTPEDAAKARRYARISSVGRSRYAHPAGHRSHQRGSGCGTARGFRWIGQLLMAVDKIRAPMQEQATSSARQRPTRDSRRGCRRTGPARHGAPRACHPRRQAPHWPAGTKPGAATKPATETKAAAGKAAAGPKSAARPKPAAGTKAAARGEACRRRAEGTAEPKRPPGQGRRRDQSRCRDQPSAEAKAATGTKPGAAPEARHRAKPQ